MLLLLLLLLLWWWWLLLLLLLLLVVVPVLLLLLLLLLWLSSSLTRSVGRSVTGLAPHPTDPDVYATVGDDCTLRIWSAEHRRPNHEMAIETMSRAVAWAPSGDFIALGLGGHTRRGRSNKDGSFLIISAASMLVEHEGRDSREWITDAKCVRSFGGLAVVGWLAVCLFVCLFVCWFVCLFWLVGDVLTKPPLFCLRVRMRVSSPPDIRRTARCLRWRRTTTSSTCTTRRTATPWLPSVRSTPHPLDTSTLP